MHKTCPKVCATVHPPGPAPKQHLLPENQAPRKSNPRDVTPLWLGMTTVAWLLRRCVGGVAVGALCVALTSPTAMDLVCESVCVALGLFRVGPCRFDVVMGAVTGAAQPAELIAGGCNGPWLA